MQSLGIMCWRCEEEKQEERYKEPPGPGKIPNKFHKLKFLVTLILNRHRFLPVFTFHEHQKGQVKQLKKNFNDRHYNYRHLISNELILLLLLKEQ